ncbi:MAG TPA: tripartite tricarboxylate transporter substrate binding protein [Burkholderiales bacterium]|nr:tripartite tricarboxylate transporter substrate binding protein [Burkholderiales bacterium]
MARVTARIVAVVCAIATLPATAAGYPEKPIRILTPFSAGSVTDLLARPLAAKLSEAWGQPVVVDNRTGAGGTIAAEIVAKANPEGYTLLVGATGPTIINPLLVKSLGYDAQRAFTPITLTATNNLLLTVTPSLPAKSVRELIELARAKPGQLRYGSPGIGSSPHLTGELLQSMAGIDLVHVAYKGSPQYTIDLLAGRIDFVFAAAGALLPHIKSGRLRLLAVGSASRDPAMPDVPAVNETVPGFEVVGWYGLLTTAGTPAPVIRKLHAELVRILGEPDVKTLYANAGLETAISASPAQFAAYIASEREKWAKVVKAANIRIE